MAIKVHCDGCSTQFSVRDDLAGRSVRCKHCDSPIRVPKSRQSRTKPEENDSDDELPTRTKRRKAPRLSQSLNPVLEWLRRRVTDVTIAVICIVVALVQAIYYLHAQDHPENYAAYYSSILYFATPAVVVLLVLSMRAVAPDEHVMVQIGKLILGLAVGIGVCVVCHMLGIRGRAVRGIGLLLFGGMAAANQAKYGGNSSMKHPVIFLIPLLIAGTVAGFAAHFLRESLEGRNIAIRKAMHDVAPALFEEP